MLYFVWLIIFKLLSTIRLCFEFWLFEATSLKESKVIWTGSSCFFHLLSFFSWYCFIYFENRDWAIPLLRRSLGQSSTSRGIHGQESLTLPKNLLERCLDLTSRSWLTDFVLNYGEFVSVSVHFEKIATNKSLHKAFSFVDQNQSEYIEVKELRRA